MMIRAALLSFWHVHADDYIRQVMAHPSLRLVAAWDSDADRGRISAAEAKLDFVEDLDQLLGRPDIDAVIIQCPTTLHVEVITKAIKAGRHVFSDKVLAPQGLQAQALADLAERHGVILVTALTALSHDYVLTARKLISRGELGRLVNIRIMGCHARILDGTLPAGFLNPSESAGGVVIDMCHPVYILPFLVGKMPHSVYAIFSNISGNAIEDQSSILCEYADGLQVMIQIGAVTRGATRMALEINGTEGSLRFSSDGPMKVTGAPDGAVMLSAIGHPSRAKPVSLHPPGQSPLDLWVDAIAGAGSAKENTGQAVALSWMTDAIYRSAALGQRVNFANLPIDGAYLL